jgi:hypothetical protein
LFGRKSRAERLKEEAQGNSLGTTLVTAYDGARPVIERLLYDDDLRDNVRTFVDSTRKIRDKLSNEDPTDIVTRLWDDDKLRKEVEAAAEAAQEGVKRVQGQRVRSGGGGGSRKLLLILALAGVGFLFLNPRTGPEARRIAGDVFSSLRSGS